ncbi:hypothetical protein Tco_1211727 [Tanacetum coccineum]
MTLTPPKSGSSGMVTLGCYVKVQQSDIGTTLKWTFYVFKGVYSQHDMVLPECIEKIVQIRERLKTARSRQKSYADKRRKPFEFKVGDRVLLKVSPWKGVVRFGKKGKLAPRYVGPFEIVLCQLFKYTWDEIEIDENLRFVEEPIEIVERDVKKLKRRRIPLGQSVGLSGKE